MKNLVPIFSLLALFALLAFGVAAISPVAQAQAEERRALTAGKVEAQAIENSAAKDKAAAWAAAWAEMLPVLVNSAKGTAAITSVILIVLAGYLAYEVALYFQKKRKSPMFQIVGANHALVTSGNINRVIDLPTGRIVDLLTDAPASAEMTQATIAAVMAQAQAAQPVTMASLQSANKKV